MKCEKAERLIMRHFDGELKPKDAIKLARHVVVCENCREIYLALDNAVDSFLAEASAGEIFAETSADFTEVVMKKCASLNLTRQKKSGSLAAKIAWAVAAVSAAVALVLVGVMTDFYDFAWGVAQGELSIVTEGLALVALAFVALMGGLLFILHGSEKVEV